jgi:hypothetical protein
VEVPEETTECTFAKALEALKQGKRVQRVGWNGAGLFVFKQVHADIPATIVPNMQSLPQSVKDEFDRRFKDPAMTDGKIKYRNQFCMVYPDNTIYEWVPSANDLCQDDWLILD